MAATDSGERWPPYSMRATAIMVAANTQYPADTAVPCQAHVTRANVTPVANSTIGYRIEMGEWQV